MMKQRDLNRFRLWLLILFLTSSIVIVLNSFEDASGAPPLTLYANSAVICYVPFYIKNNFKRKIRLNNPIFLLLSTYAFGALLLTFTRSNFSSELPRTLIMSISIWSGLMMGSSIGRSRDFVEDFMITILLFGVSISLISLFTGIGITSSIQDLTIGRANRLWTIAFGVIDPVCMFSAGLYLLINGTRRKSFFCSRRIYFICTILSFLLILYSSTRIFLVGLAAIVLFIIISRLSLQLRIYAFPFYLIAILLIWYWFTQIADIQSFSILQKFGFTNTYGHFNLEGKRSILYQHLFDIAQSSPFSGIGINSVKESVYLIEGSAKTEYGYYLHIASYGFIIPLPFYAVMIFGGVFRPLISLLTQSRKYLIKAAPIYGAAIACFIAGFSGYYGQATAIAQFVALIFIGLATRYDPKQLHSCQDN